MHGHDASARSDTDFCNLQQAPNTVDTLQNLAYGTARPIQTEKNDAYVTVDQVQDSVDLLKNVAYGTAEPVQTEINDAYVTTDQVQDSVDTARNLAYGTAKPIQMEKNDAYVIADHVSLQQNQAYSTVKCEIDPEQKDSLQTCSALTTQGAKAPGEQLRTAM